MFAYTYIEHAMWVAAVSERENGIPFTMCFATGRASQAAFDVIFSPNKINGAHFFPLMCFLPVFPTLRAYLNAMKATQWCVPIAAYIDFDVTFKLVHHIYGYRHNQWQQV